MQNSTRAVCRQATEAEIEQNLSDMPFGQRFEYSLEPSHIDTLHTRYPIITRRGSRRRRT